MPKITGQISPENIAFLDALARAEGISKYAAFSAIADAAIEAARKENPGAAADATRKNAPTIGERLRRIEARGKFNSELLSIMLKNLAPQAAADFQEAKRKYL